jgi:hypothetical protein
MGILQLIIRNDAMKTDPHEIYGWRVFAVACSVSFPDRCYRQINDNLTMYILQASFGALLFGMDSGTIGGVLTMPSFKT